MFPHVFLDGSCILCSFSSMEQSVCYVSFKLYIEMLVVILARCLVFVSIIMFVWKEMVIVSR
jgi:hypothetical protein